MEEKIEIKLGDYFHGTEVKQKDVIAFTKIARQLNPDFIYDERGLTKVTEPASIAGDYFLIGGYGFRKSAWGFECLITPEGSYDTIINETLKDMKPGIMKAKGDRGKNYFTRYHNSKGGKDEFNPVSKTGGFEEIVDTKRRLNI